MKAYTNIEQSKKLAEILPIESADMVYIWQTASYNPASYNPALRFDEDMPPIVLKDALKDIPTNKITVDILPCWSLAALLSVLPNKIVSHETAFEEEDAEAISDTYYKHLELTEDSRYMCCYVGNGYKYKCVADIPVDACYEMILKLNELKML